MFPAQARPFFASGGFDPADYPGFKGYWLADDALVDGGSLVTSVPAADGTLGALVAFGAPVYEATAWPADASPAVIFSNADARALMSSTGFDAEADFDLFLVFSADSDVADANLQWAALLGTFGDIFAVAHTRAFDSANWAYRQDVGWVANSTDALSGPQVWALRHRAADSPNLEVWRNDIESMSGDITSFPVDALQIGGLVIGGAPIGPGTQLNGLWKAAALYQGALLSLAESHEITAGLTSLFL